MARPLTAEERALWRRVTADVTPHRPTPDHPADAIDAPAAAPTVQAKPAPPRPQPKLRALPLMRATLDGRWDRQLREGTAIPDRFVDLHGCTVQRAHDRVLQEVEAAVVAGDRLIVLVTGKPPPPGASRLDAPLRGIIRASIVDWLVAHQLGGRIAAIRPAHPRHGGTGALYIVLRRTV